MRTFFTFVSIFACGLALAGCGDDTAGGATDLGVMLDQGSANAADCAAYCAQMEATCVPGAASDGGAVAPRFPYVNHADCLDYCGKVAGWSANPATGNTLGCRLAAVQAAAGGSDVAGNCDVAGPTGDNVCGSWCENYCQLMLKNCSGANTVYNAATCMTKCATMSASGKPGDVVGNTVQCRIYHMGVAFHDPVTHCPHGKTIADNPSGPCQ